MPGIRITACLAGAGNGGKVLLNTDPPWTVKETPMPSHTNSAGKELQRADPLSGTPGQTARAGKGSDDDSEGPRGQ